MSNLRPGNGVRDVYISDGGDNAKRGINLTEEKVSFNDSVGGTGAITEALDKSPSLFDPVGIVDVGASRYVENIDIPDNVQTSVPACSFQSLGGIAVKAGANATLDLLTISTSGTPGDIAYSTDGKSRVGLDAKAIILNGTQQIGVSVDGTTEQAFPVVGQILARNEDSIGLSYTSTGEEPRYFQFNELNWQADNCKGIFVDAGNTRAAVFRTGAITYEDDILQPTQTGAGSVGIHVKDGFLVGYSAENLAETVVLVEEDGDLITDFLYSQGSIVNLGKLNLSSRRHEGDIVVGPSGYATLNIDEHLSGNVLNFGILNGRIGETEYGTWYDPDDDTISNSFFRQGNIPSSETPVGFLGMDTSTDTLTNILCTYRQTSSGSRTVNFALVDADDPLTVYYSYSSVNSGSDNAVTFKLTDMTPVAPLPVSQETNLLILINRGGFGGGVKDFNCQIERDRTV